MLYTLSEKDGKTPVPCRKDFAVWAAWFNEADRQVGFDKLGDIHVSTVFLGRTDEHRGGQPLLFETAVIGGPHDYPPELYCTWDEAKIGHKRWVALVSAKVSVTDLMAVWGGKRSLPRGEARGTP